MVEIYEQIKPYFELGPNERNSLEILYHFKLFTGRSKSAYPLYPPGEPVWNDNNQIWEWPDPKDLIDSVKFDFPSMKLETLPEDVQTNLADLLAFDKLLDLERQASEPHGSLDNSLVTGSDDFNLFETHYSVGFARAKLQPHDRIFAVDGVPTPLILRQHPERDTAYRVVGECYLWAALELDYWNPGTRKGRWRTRLYDLGQVQTRTIEMY